MTVIAAAISIAHSSSRSGPISTSKRTIASRMATNWTFAFSLPQIEGAKHGPVGGDDAAQAEDEELAPDDDDGHPRRGTTDLDERDQGPRTRSLSAVVSRNEPSVVVTRQRRAR